MVRLAVAFHNCEGVQKCSWSLMTRRKVSAQVVCLYTNSQDKQAVSMICCLFAEMPHSS
jgi:hypothetical protein